MNIEFPSEEVIESYVHEQVSSGNLCPITDEQYESSFRQVSMGRYGRADLVRTQYLGCDTHLIQVVELKNFPLKASDICQLCRYMRAMEKAMSEYMGDGFEVSGILAGPIDARNSELSWVIENLTNIDVYDISCSLEHGFQAELIPEGWHYSGEDLSGLSVISETAIQNCPVMPPKRLALVKPE